MKRSTEKKRWEYVRIHENRASTTQFCKPLYFYIVSFVVLSLLEAILLGILQGFTEWFPISSSGHLVVAQHLLGVKVPVLFDILLHCGTLTALLFFLRGDIMRLTRTVLTLDFSNDSMPLLILFGTIPTALAGYFLHDFIVGLFTVKAVGFSFLITGAIVFLARERKKGKVGFFSAFCIGVAQGISLVPGISRSGITIASALWCGVEGNEAMRFSFLLSIPAVLGAMAYESRDAALATVPLQSVFAGFLISMLVGFFSLIVVARIMRRGEIHYFSYYCFAVGLLVILTFAS